MKRIKPILFFFHWALIWVLAGCHAPQSYVRRHGYFDRDGPPDFRVDTQKDAKPKHEPYSRYGNPKQYCVKGRCYRPLSTHIGYRATGLASWYGMQFHHRRASSGEIYKVTDMTAAHRTLPIPCYVRVTHLDNHRSVIVKVNDRGPFCRNRILDLSFAAAKKIGVYPKGTARVHIEAIDARTFEKHTSFAHRSFRHQKNQSESTSGIWFQVVALQSSQKSYCVYQAFKRALPMSVTLIQKKNLYVVRVKCDTQKEINQLHQFMMKQRMGRPMRIGL